MSLLEPPAVIVSALSVWLTTRRKMLSWPIGLISVSLYGWVFWKAKLYSNILLQFTFAVLQAYGWWCWSKNLSMSKNSPRGEIVVKRIPPGLGAIHLLVGAAGSVMLGYLMSSMTDAAVPWIDAALTSFSLVAQLWLARQYVACWWLWIIIDTIYVVVFGFKELYLTAVLYMIFIILAIMGLRSWQQALNLQTASDTA